MSESSEQQARASRPADRQRRLDTEIEQRAWAIWESVRASRHSLNSAQGCAQIQQAIRAASADLDVGALQAQVAAESAKFETAKKQIAKLRYQLKLAKAELATARNSLAELEVETNWGPATPLHAKRTANKEADHA